LRLLAGPAELLEKAAQPGIKDKFLTTWRRLHALWNGHPRFRAMGHLWMHLCQAPGVDITALRRLIDRHAALVAAVARLASQAGGDDGTGIE
jgi:hypothetical protein